MASQPHTEGLVTGAETATAAVALDGISVRYGPIQALQAISLDVARGERLAIVGESGAGKSTLLHVIAGLIRPAAGRVMMSGREVATLDPAERSVGLVFQSEALFPHMTVFENVAFPLRAIRWSATDTRQRVLSLLAQVELYDRAVALPRQLSGGQQQRVALARALARRPSVLLFDEPLANLDSALRRRLRELLLQLHSQERFTLVIVTHDPDEAAQVGERVAVLREGRLVALNTVHELFWTAPSTYVATLLGPCNQLPVSLESEQDNRFMTVGRKRLLVPPGLRFPVNGSRAAVLLVRPEAVMVSVAEGSGGMETGWIGRVAATRDLGRVWSIRLETEGFDGVEAHLPARPGVGPPVVGTPVAWTVDWARAHVVREDVREEGSLHGVEMARR